MRKNCPDGCLPLIKSTGLHSFNNIMIIKVSDELRKPGESKYQLATLDPTKEDTSWPADDYVKKLIPDYPKKEKREEINEKKGNSTLKESSTQQGSKTEKNIKNESYHNKNKRHYDKRKQNGPMQHNRFKQHHYRKQKPPPVRQQRRRASNWSQVAHKPNSSLSQFIDPWIRPSIPDEIIGLNNSPVILNQPPPKFAEPLYLRPKRNDVFQIQMQPPLMPFHNQTFNGNNSLPSANVYVEPMKSIGLLGDCPSENAPQKVDDYSNYGHYDQPYDPNVHEWEDMPASENWTDSYQDYPQNMYQGNHGRGRNPDRQRNINFAKGRGWKGTVSRGNKGPYRGNRKGHW